MGTLIFNQKIFLRLDPLVRKLFRLVTAVMLAGTLAGCQSLARAPYLPQQLAASSPSFRYDLAEPSSQRRFVADLENTVVDAPGGDALAISGGGANGAFGAGVMYGWSLRGGRPRFDVVTGVSAGALVAPFVFAGPQFDGELKSAFVDGRSQKLMRFRGFGALFKPGLYRGDPLRKLVRQSLSTALIKAVAREHSKGRRLYIATVSLDAQRQIVWDAGELARRGDPVSLKMLEDILVASASVPGIFPPVLIKVQNGVNAVMEMHVDGGAVSNFFIWPEDFPIDFAPKGRLSRVFVILNSRIDPNFSVVRYGGVKIASRSFETMQKYATARQLKYVEKISEQRHIDLSVAEIPAEYSSGFLDFSRDRMANLFNQGAELGKSGRAFQRSDRAGK